MVYLDHFKNSRRFIILSGNMLDIKLCYPYNPQSSDYLKTYKCKKYFEKLLKSKSEKKSSILYMEMKSTHLRILKLIP